MKKNRIVSIICALAMMMSMFSMFVVAEAADTTGHSPVYTLTATNPTTTNKQFTVEVKYTGIPSDLVVSAVGLNVEFDTTKLKFVKFDKKTEATVSGTNNAGKGFAFAGMSDTSVGGDGTVIGIFTLELIDDAAVADTSTYALNITTAKIDLTDADTLDTTSYTKAANNLTIAAPATIDYVTAKVDTQPTYTDVTVTADKTSAKPGDKVQFSAVVNGTPGWDLAGDKERPVVQTVKWEVVSGSATINETSGELTVAADAAAGSEIEVKATSTASAAATGTLKIKVGGQAVTIGTASGVTVNDVKIDKVQATAAADAADADLQAFTDSITAATNVYAAVTGKAANDVVVGTAYVPVDKTALSAITKGATVELGNVGLVGATKYEVTLVIK